MALDDAILLENSIGEGGGDEDDDGRNDVAVQDENWVLKILHMRYLWREDDSSRGRATTST